MPKQTYKITAFHGGINSDSDPRDLQPDQSPSLVDAAIDSVGRIKTLGKVDSGSFWGWTGTAQAQGSPATNKIILASGSETVDNYYNGYAIVITGGTNDGEARIIDDDPGYVGSTLTATLTVAFTAACDNTTVYKIYNSHSAFLSTKHQGLFTMKSDRQLDGGSANETLIFLYDNNESIDVYDSEGWDHSLITFSGTVVEPCYYAADGVLRVSDGNFTRESEWFGYIADQTFASLNAVGPSAAWVNVDQSLAAPTSGMCLISNPEDGGDGNGVNSPAKEYIGNVIDAGGSGDVVDHSAVNLRVGLQYDEELQSGHDGWDHSINNVSDPGSDNADLQPLFGDANTKMVTSGNAIFSAIGVDGLSYAISEEASLILGFFVITTEYDKLSKVTVTAGTASSNHIWRFSVDELAPNCWNYLVCSPSNVDVDASASIDWGTSIDRFYVSAYQNGVSGTSGNASPTFYVSGPLLAKTGYTGGWQPGIYTFHYTWLYDVENKQESLPFQFSDLDTGGEPDNVNKVCIAGDSVLLNFDAYICSNNATPAYSLNQRISGARLYWKIEENDNYFLIGELDFVEKGFKWVPESDSFSYSITDTSNTTGNILGKTAIAKGIYPSSSNTIDTFKSNNGFSSEVKSIDAQYKTAVVQGRRAYVGNIKQNGKTHPDRILKSQINKFDTFPDKMGSVDVAIRDGESVIKLEAFADRILQFKEDSLYIINVSEAVDFLEDTYRSKGCAHQHHTVKTDLGIAWFNIHGAYIYDGQRVHNLLEKNGVRLISETDWEAFITDGEDGTADDTGMGNAMIGYIPKKRQILIKNDNLDVFIYDFVLSAWMKGAAKLTVTSEMTNFALDSNQDLFYIDGVNSTFKTWQTSSQASGSGTFVYKTQDIDFGEPGVRKKIYKAYVSYKGDGSAVTCTYAVNGDTDTVANFYKIGVTGATTGATDSTTPFYGSAVGTDDWVLAELKPVASINNKYSFQLVFGGTAAADFEINDITIVYRMKNIK